MIKKRYGVPALILGLAMIGGTSAYAFGPGGIDVVAFSGFTSDEQAAIQKAHEIRQAADEETKAVLEAAGVTEEEIRTAMDSFREAQHEKLDAALESNDYDAFKALVAGSPMEENLTEDIFAKLVEIHELEESGDREGAMELRKELADDGFMGGFGLGHGPKPVGE